MKRDSQKPKFTPPFWTEQLCYPDHVSPRRSINPGRDNPAGRQPAPSDTCPRRRATSPFPAPSPSRSQAPCRLWADEAAESRWGGRLAGSPGRPRALPHRGSRLPRPRGPALGCREPARTARGCGSGAAEAAGKVRARPTVVSWSVAGAAPGRASLRGRRPGATEAPPPPRFPRSPEPAGRPGPGGGNCRPWALRVRPRAGPGPPDARLRRGWPLTSGRRNPEEGGKKKRPKGGRGKTFIFSPIFFRG